MKPTHIFVVDRESVELYVNGKLVDERKTPDFPAPIKEKFDSTFSYLGFQPSVYADTSRDERKQLGQISEAYGRALFEMLNLGKIEGKLYHLPAVHLLILDPELADLHWEFLHDGNNFLSLVTPVSRILGGEGVVAGPLESRGEGEMRFSLFTAQPRFPGYLMENPPPLDVQGVPQEIAFHSEKSLCAPRWDLCPKLTRDRLAAAGDFAPDALYISTYMLKDRLALEHPEGGEHETLSVEEFAEIAGGMARRGLGLVVLNLKPLTVKSLHEFSFKEYMAYAEAVLRNHDKLESALFQAGVPRVCRIDANLAPHRVRQFLQRFFFVLMLGEKPEDACKSALNFLAHQEPLSWDWSFIRLAAGDFRHLNPGEPSAPPKSAPAPKQELLERIESRESLISSYRRFGLSAVLGELERRVADGGEISLESEKFEDRELYVEEFLKRAEGEADFEIGEVCLPEELIRAPASFVSIYFNEFFNGVVRDSVTWGFIRSFVFPFISPRDSSSARKVLTIFNGLDEIEDNRKFFLKLQKNADLVFRHSTPGRRGEAHALNVDCTEPNSAEIIRNTEGEFRAEYRRIDPSRQSLFLTGVAEIFPEFVEILEKETERGRLAIDFFEKLAKRLSKQEYLFMNLMLIHRSKMNRELLEYLLKELGISDDCLNLLASRLIKRSVNMKYTWANPSLTELYLTLPPEHRARLMESSLEKLVDFLFRVRETKMPQPTLFLVCGVINELIAVNPGLGYKRLLQISRKFFFPFPDHKRISQFLLLRAMETSFALDDRDLTEKILEEYLNAPYLIPEKSKDALHRCAIDFLKVRQNWELNTRFHLLSAHRLAETEQRVKAQRVLYQVRSAHLQLRGENAFSPLFALIFEFYFVRGFLDDAARVFEEYFHETGSSEAQAKRAAKDCWTASALLEHAMGDKGNVERDLDRGLAITVPFSNVLDVMGLDLKAEMALEAGDLDAVWKLGSRIAKLLREHHSPRLKNANELRFFELQNQKGDVKKAGETLVNLYDYMKKVGDRSAQKHISDLLGGFFYKTGDPEKSTEYYSISSWISEKDNRNA